MLEVAGQFVTTYTFPEDQPRSTRFEVWAEGLKVDAFHADKADFAMFECAGPVSLLVTLAADYGNPILRPLARGLHAHLEAPRRVTLTIPGPGHYCLDFEGRVPLFIYAGAPDPEPAPRGEDHVHYFAAGRVYEVGELTLKDHETLYIEGGAVLRGSIRATSARHVSIRGRGILDGSYDDFNAGARQRLAVFEHCRDVLIEGITMINGSSWMLVLGASEDIVIRDLKQIGSHISTDGIDICGSRNVLIENCCLRNDDDNIVIKSLATNSTANYLSWEGNVENVHIRHCVLLNGVPGNAMEIGYELRAETIRDIVFEDIDVISAHGEGAVFSIHNGDRALIEDIRWENIRVEHYWDKLIDFRVVKSRYNHDLSRGTIRNILLKNIKITSSIFNPGCSISLIGGYEPENPITGITLEDFQINNHRITSVDELELHTRHAAPLTII
jgi:polygalacturonase